MSSTGLGYLSEARRTEDTSLVRWDDCIRQHQLTRSVGYDPASATLELEFQNGSLYQYFDVPTARHAGLMSAYSKGSYFDTFIRGGGYTHQQIR